MTDSYDEIAYPGFPFPETHPDRLSVIGRLLGMKPAPATRCRVLELGCGDGGNLIPMALALPGSEFVGIDLAGQPIARGQALAGELGLRNIRLLQMDLRDFAADPGIFDYVIAYGLYSWVPEDARRMLVLLDGTRDRAALIEELLPLTGGSRETLAPALDGNLTALARLGLLAPERRCTRS